MRGCCVVSRRLIDPGRRLTDDLYLVPVFEPVNGFRRRQGDFDVAAADPALGATIVNVQADGFLALT
jgi:hypothetical protein